MNDEPNKRVSRTEKDVTIRVPNRARKDLEAVRREWPFPRTRIVTAALSWFRRLSPQEQVEEIRRTAACSAGVSEHGSAA